MTYWILTYSGRVIARSTVQHITISDLVTDAIHDCVPHFDATLLTHLSDKNFQIEHPNPVFYLQDNHTEVDAAVAHVPADIEYWDM